LLVGTQIDLRDDAATVEKLAKNKQRVITIDQGEKLARELKAVKYVECSALTQVSRANSISPYSQIGNIFLELCLAERVEERL